MNQILLTKDIRLMLKDLKFQIFFLILVILFLLSAISSSVAYKNQTIIYQKKLIAFTEMINDGYSTQLINMLSSGEILVISNPSPALLFNNYINFPDMITTDLMYYSPELSQFDEENLEIFQINWFFILGILSGFIMLIMSFEAISREKRAGTLRLISVYGYKRQTILWHKYISYMILYLIVTIPPALISVVLFFALTGAWSLGFMLKFLLILLISIPFASFFVLMGILISMAKNYRNAIVMVVFIWLLLVIIIPQSANIIAEEITPIRANIEYAEMASKAFSDEWAAWSENYESVRGNQALHDGLRARAVSASYEKYNAVELLKVDENTRQTKMILNISSLSPFTQLDLVSEIIFDKGFYLFIHQQEAAKRSISQIKSLMIEQDSHDESSLNLFYAWASTDNGGLKEGEVAFSSQLFQHPDLLLVSDIPTEDALNKTLKIFLQMIPIMVLNLLLIVCSVIKINKMDIR